MNTFLLFLAFVIPQILFVYALLFGVAAILKREEAAEKEKKREERLYSLLQPGVEVGKE